MLSEKQILLSSNALFDPLIWSFPQKHASIFTLSVSWLEQPSAPLYFEFAAAQNKIPWNNYTTGYTFSPHSGSKWKFRIVEQFPQAQLNIFTWVNGSINWIKTTFKQPPVSAVIPMHRCTTVIHLLPEEMPKTWLFFSLTLAILSDWFSCQQRALCHSRHIALCPT